MSKDGDEALRRLMNAASNDNHADVLQGIHDLAVRAIDDPTKLSANEILDLAWTALLFAHWEIKGRKVGAVADQSAEWKAGLGEHVT